MSYAPTTDFLALLRRTDGGVALARVPGLDFVVSAMARASVFRLWVGQDAPNVNQSTTVWLRPALPSWTAEGVVFLYDGDAGTYRAATPDLWAQLLTSQADYVFQSVSIASAEVKASTTLLAVQRTTPVVTALLLPAIIGRHARPLRIADWSAGVSEHAIALSTPDGSTIMRRATWVLNSTLDQLAGVTLHPSIDLNGWVIAP